MLPNINVTPETYEAYAQAVYPGKTYEIDFDNGRVKGFIDDIDAIKQSIYCILNTERYRYLIYSSNYGFEMTDLIGKDKRFVMPELQQRIAEALMQDDRILSVSGFTFNANNANGTKLTVNFKVTTNMDETIDYEYKAVI